MAEKDEKEVEDLADRKVPTTEIEEPWELKIPNEIYEEINEFKNEINSLFDSISEPSMIKEVASKFIDLIAKNKTLLSNEQVDYFVEILGNPSSCDYLTISATLQILYKYIKHFPKDEEIYLPEPTIFIIKDLFPDFYALKVMSAIIIRNPNLSHNLLQLYIDQEHENKDPCFKFKILMSSWIDSLNPGSLYLMNSIWKAKNGQTNWFNLFDKIIKNTPAFGEHQKIAFKAIREYIIMDESQSKQRASRLIDQPEYSEIFINLCQDEKAVYPACQLIIDIAYYTDVSLEFLLNFHIKTIFRWLLKRTIDYHKGVYKTYKRNNLTHGFKLLLEALLNMLTNEEQAPLIVNWIINEGLFSEMMESYNKVPSFIWDRIICITANMVLDSTFSMFVEMNKYPFIFYMIEVMANSSLDEDNDDLLPIKQALQHILIFLQIQNGSEDFQHVLEKVDVDATNNILQEYFKITGEAQPRLIYDPNNELISLPDELRDQIVDLIQQDDDEHPYLSEFLEQIDELYGVTDRDE